MKVLIDTHIAIWAVLNYPKLPRQARCTSESRRDNVFNT